MEEYSHSDTYHSFDADILVIRCLMSLDLLTIPVDEWNTNEISIKLSCYVIICWLKIFFSRDNFMC